MEKIDWVDRTYKGPESDFEDSLNCIVQNILEADLTFPPVLVEDCDIMIRDHYREWLPLMPISK